LRFEARIFSGGFGVFGDVSADAEAGFGIRSRNTRKTGAVSSGHRKGCGACLLSWWHSSAPFALDHLPIMRLFFHFMALVFEAEFLLFAGLRFEPKLGFALFGS